MEFTGLAKQKTKARMMTMDFHPPSVKSVDVTPKFWHYNPKI
jgi:hypothetical protein